MKTKRKITKTIVLVILAIIIMPFQVFAEKNLEPVTTLGFSDVKPLVMARYQVILNNIAAYNNTNNAQGNIQTGTTNINDLLVALAGINSADADITSLKGVVAGLLQAQANIAVAQNSMAQSTSITDIGIQTEQGNYSIVWNMESMYITYNSLSHQIIEMEAKKPLLEGQVKAAQLQRKLGMITDAGVESAISQLEELKTGIEQLEVAQDAIRQTFNVNLAQDYDTEIDIQEVPDVKAETIAAIQPDSDYTEALKKSYTVRLNDNDIDKENDAKRNFKKSFYSLHQTILDKQKALDLEKTKFSVAEKNFKASELKYKLGLLSKVQYQLEYSNYISKKMSLAKAGDSLFQAFRAYEWAKQGLIVSATSGS